MISIPFICWERSRLLGLDTPIVVVGTVLALALPKGVESGILSHTIVNESTR